jgi:hypothetical protein
MKIYLNLINKFVSVIADIMYYVFSARYELVLGAFAKPRKATISFMASVCLFASAPTGRIRIKFDV